jgi:hypothetical protein
MSEAKHTPGVLLVTGEVGSREVTILTQDFRRAFDPTDCEEAHGNMSRAVACWNACKDIADPTAVPDLLAACEAAMKYAAMCTGNSIKMTVEGGKKAGQAFSKAKAAIAKAKGGSQ